MLELIGHSKRFCGQVQSYKDHASGTVTWGLRILTEWRPFLSKDLFRAVYEVLPAVMEVHDLGKLDEENQRIMRDETHCGRLPIPHQYAGTWYVYRECGNVYAAALICGHHRPGLPDLNRELSSAEPFCGIFKKNETERKEFQKLTDERMEAYIKAHCKAMEKEFVLPEFGKRQFSALEERMMLSCLVHADWSDTGGRDTEKEEIPRRWEERLNQLDVCVDQIYRKAEKGASEEMHARNALRQEVYQECRNRVPVEKNAMIYHGDACVGTGKTTAFLALALRLAIRQNLRHIVIVLPYISILTQVEHTLKSTMVLPEEKENEIVAVIHYRAEYENYKLRQLAASWETPIILTTAVAFYESLASNEPAHLHKLQELPGSAIILDEFPASAPVECLPVIWNWLGELSKNWGCPVILSSGTMVHFWKNRRFKEAYGNRYLMPVPKPVFSDELQKKMEAAERGRVQMRFSKEDLERCRFGRIDDLLDFALEQEGPRIIMVETREAAARIACRLKLRNKRVFHVSNALKPEDCSRILDLVIELLGRAKNSVEDCDLTLVTTTYAGMGLNLSFKTGFCQIFSCALCLQLIGRISRNHDYAEAALWAFELADPSLPENCSMKISKEVWREILYDHGDGVPAWQLPPSELASYAFGEETKRLVGQKERQKQLLHLERSLEFAEMAKQFQVIPDESELLAIVDSEMVRAVRFGKYYDRVKIRQKSIAIYKSMVERLELKEIVENTGLYELREEQYDPELLGVFKTLVE